MTLTLALALALTRARAQARARARARAPILTLTTDPSPDPNLNPNPNLNPHPPPEKAAASQGANQAEKLTLLARGGALHQLGRYQLAAEDYGAVVAKAGPQQAGALLLTYPLTVATHFPDHALTVATLTSRWTPSGCATAWSSTSSAKRRRGSATSGGWPPSATLCGHTSASLPSSAPCQPQIKRRAASSLGQPRPIGSCVLDGRPHRPRFPRRFDIEPESQLALYMATASAGGERGAAEALRLWTVAPASVKEAAAGMDFAQRQWPPAAEKAAKAFLAVVTANGLPPTPSR